VNIDEVKVLVVDRRLVHGRNLGYSGRAGPDPVDLEMVRVPIDSP
jgi:hypothetical protein